ncbi:MAG TPA: hypothetical protein VMZ30_02070 [Pyrinomonadaceae bacterium]|nr:hypothetical protein [Pyrinomonadaceae bacterium]
MPSKNNMLSLHQTLAHEIKAAKKTLFKRHREGLPARQAADQFLIDIAQRFERSIAAKRNHGSVSVPIIGTAGPDGIKLFDEVVDENKLDERDRVQGEVNSMLNFFDAPAPDFINDAIVDAIGQACAHFEIDEPEYEIGYQGQTREVLTQLFAKTRMFKLSEIETPVIDLAWAISTIIKSPITPARLRQIVADFKTDITEPTDLPEEIENALGFGQCGWSGCPGSGDPLNPCPGPDTSGAHVGEQEPDKHNDNESVTATLPNVDIANAPANDDNSPDKQLAAIGLADEDLDRFANYFTGRFEHDTEPAVVLVALLERLVQCSKDQRRNMEDAINRLEDRLFAKSAAGQDTASAFRDEASDEASRIFNGEVDDNAAN